MEKACGFGRLPNALGYLEIEVSVTKEFATQVLNRILNQPLRHFDFFRSLLYEYVEVADKFQDELFFSDIYKASSIRGIIIGDTSRPQKA
uniref:RGS domain-containing protein n=1 Tax=Heterorhabditis bacteriophora TaxID=37862 RepID=A0A1I7WXM6_HETBA